MSLASRALFHRNQRRIAFHEARRYNRAHGTRRHLSIARPHFRGVRLREKPSAVTWRKVIRTSHTLTFTTCLSWIVVKFLAFMLALTQEFVYATISPRRRRRGQA